MHRSNVPIRKGQYRTVMIETLPARGAAWLLMTCLTLFTGGCRREPPTPPPVVGPIQFKDVSNQVGVTFVHTDGSSGERYIVEPMSAGLALFDYDGDGLIDIYLLNGRPLLGANMNETPRNALYRNLGGWRFVDVTMAAGVGDTGFGLGVTVGDYDNDGNPDLYVNNYGPNVLYRNNGDGTFSDVTPGARVDNGDLVGAAQVSWIWMRTETWIFMWLITSISTHRRM